MMKSIPVFAILLLLFACNRVNQNIQTWEKSIQHAEKHHRSYQEKDWMQLQSQMVQLQDFMTQETHPINPEQRKVMNQILGRYTALTVMNAVEDIKQPLEDFNQQLEQTLKSLEKGLQ